jgi:hypothetical protein
MKTLEKSVASKLPKAKFAKVDSIPFLNGTELFVEKNLAVTEYLKNVKLPPR